MRDAQGIESLRRGSRRRSDVKRDVLVDGRVDRRRGRHIATSRCLGRPFAKGQGVMMIETPWFVL